MFVKVGSVNYFIIPDNKTISQIYYEVVSRMDKYTFSETEKRYIMSQIKEQFKDKIV
jgi:hypothetical protein